MQRFIVVPSKSTKEVDDTHVSQDGAFVRRLGTADGDLPDKDEDEK